ncbi:uncharacterized protein LOC129839937 [Salvelinus fontinalis]|uniref:uncharacterized protein LOC129839937 n=1 Tax=Salvelinus fontinalis TaxID=8038 RepID=UPI0024857450|nr:uncharacterized protein LOC129839937 [Salvelinus fontinalis]
MSPTPVSQTPVLSSTAVSPPSPPNPIQEHTTTGPVVQTPVLSSTAVSRPSPPNPIQEHTPTGPVVQTPVLSSTAVSHPSPPNPIQEHTTTGPVVWSTHPDHSVSTPTPTALTSPRGPNTTPLYPAVTTSPVVTTATQPSLTTTQPISSTQSSPRLRTTRPPPWPAPQPSQGSPSAGTSSVLSPSPLHSTISSTHRPRVYILPDRPAAIKEESIELLLQVILEESSSDLNTSLEDDTAAWVAPYLQRAPGFQDLQGVWSR